MCIITIFYQNYDKNVYKIKNNNKYKVIMYTKQFSKLKKRLNKVEFFSLDVKLV